MMNSLPANLAERKVFTHQDFAAAMSAQYKMTSPQIAYDLQKRIDAGNLIRIGWNQYTVQTTKRRYTPHYSILADRIAGLIDKTFVGLNFQLFELVQLNEFINHQIAHNTVFVFVENDLQNYVFDTLKQSYPGRVMLRPNIKNYYQCKYRATALSDFRATTTISIRVIILLELLYTVVDMTPLACFFKCIKFSIIVKIEPITHNSTSFKSEL